MTYLCDVDFSSLIYQMGQFIISGVSDILIFSLPYKVQRAIVVTLTVVTLTSTLALVSHLKVLHRSLFMLWLRHCQASYPVRDRSCSSLVRLYDMSATCCSHLDVGVGISLLSFTTKGVFM